MASGRCRQLRLHAVQQAGLVWGLFQGVRDEQLGRFVRTGILDAESAVDRIAYNPALLADLQKRAQ